MSSPRYQTLISPAVLVLHLGEADWVVVDCRFDLADTGKGEREYLRAHVPGAVYVHLDRDLSGPIGPATGRHPLPDAERLKSWLGSKGIGNDSQVIAYDDSGGTMAVRLWWLLRWLGHHQVAVLDGGWQAWMAAGLEADDTAVVAAPLCFKGEPHASMVTTTQDLATGLGERVLIDVRTAERFRGDREPIDPVAGHIPGAVNQPLQLNLGAGGRFRSSEELKALYGPLIGSSEAEDIIFMCGSGVTACHGMLALEIAGVSGARLYAGSWSEWIRDPSRPVAVGNS